ncbi:MAG: type II toxin-antitoxin system VapC family toxin [Deltaproteobacteria bacterium]|nr:type II toxin-antitoxin system VapC family toxin [Deltaproteobacteria bacterium]
MIVLDTHIWVWWVHGDSQLPITYHTVLQEQESQGLGVSIISCWEVAKLVEYRRLTLPCATAEWLVQALSYPGIRLLDLTPHIIVDSTQLPGSFHRDPADQLIVATARVLNVPVMTTDGKILDYQHVKKQP